MVLLTFRKSVLFFRSNLRPTTTKPFSVSARISAMSKKWWPSGTMGSLQTHMQSSQYCGVLRTTPSSISQRSFAFMILSVEHFVMSMAGFPWNKAKTQMKLLIAQALQQASTHLDYFPEGWTLDEAARQWYTSHKLVLFQVRKGKMWLPWMSGCTLNRKSN